MKLITITKAASAAISILLAYGLLASGLAFAESHETEESAAKPLDEKTITSLDQQIADIESNLIQLKLLEPRAEQATGLRQRILVQRLNRLFSTTLDGVTTAAQLVADKYDAGYDISAYKPRIVEYLTQLPAAIELITDPAEQGNQYPDSSLSAVEIAAEDERIFAAAKQFDDGSWALKRGIDAARRLGMDTTAQEVYLADRVTMLVDGVSVYLDLAMKEAASLRAAASVLVDDAELKAKVLLADKRVQRTAAVLENNMPILKSLELDTTWYRQQLVLATGQVSTDVFDTRLIASIVSDWGSSLLETLSSQGPNLIFRTLIFLLILYVFFKLARIVEGLVDKALDRSKLQISALLRRMVISASSNGIIIIGILVALSQLGISLGPLLAGLGIAGFIIGFALQDSLANFASGMLILLYRPYDVGDLVEVAGAYGKVERMSLVNTTILTLDNQTLIVPNNKIWADVIKNLTYQRIRRVDMQFSVTYSQDLDQAERVLHEVVQADERVLEDPPLNIRVHAFGDSSVNFIVRPWVKTDDYWDVFWDLNKKIKQRFDAEGISIPFPQRDVHLFAGEPAAAAAVQNMTGGASATKIIDNDPAADQEDG